jgi:hypothetical protein
MRISRQEARLWSAPPAGFFVSPALEFGTRRPDQAVGDAVEPPAAC